MINKFISSLFKKKEEVIIEKEPFDWYEAYENRKELSDTAKEYGLRTKWLCFQDCAIFSNTFAIIEICKRIENLEEQLFNHLKEEV